ncbi:MAG: pseudouridine-5'-phosphate glycosidase [Pseudomonadota bacterium]
MTLPIIESNEVKTAKAEGRPIVALESTIITHGMPAPDNIETALACEADVRAEGAVPATIAVIDGALRIGLETQDLKGFAGRHGIAKLSSADIASVLAIGGSGATTVAATMIGARLAGIEVFATGGIGGVHRGAENTFDISADLSELAASPITVVCAGPKAILDIPKTIERLETLGVPVIAHGQNDIPAFWSRSSGLPAPLRMDDPKDIAAAHVMRRKLAQPGGQLVVNPVPSAKEIPAIALLPMIEDAAAEAEAERIKAKDVTPWILEWIYRKTDGASLRTNIALVRNNARLAARIAHELSMMPKT